MKKIEIKSLIDESIIDGTVAGIEALNSSKIIENASVDDKLQFIADDFNRLIVERMSKIKNTYIDIALAQSKTQIDNEITSKFTNPQVTIDEE